MKVAATVSVIFLCVVVIALRAQGTSKSRKARGIQPNAPLGTVENLLGPPLRATNEDGMNLRFFAPDLAAAGPIRVGFDNQDRAVYMKIREDGTPEWDIRVSK